MWRPVMKIYPFLCDSFKSLGCLIRISLSTVADTVPNLQSAKRWPLKVPQRSDEWKKCWRDSRSSGNSHNALELWMDTHHHTFTLLWLNILNYKHSVSTVWWCRIRRSCGWGVPTERIRADTLPLERNSYKYRLSRTHRVVKTLLTYCQTAAVSSWHTSTCRRRLQTTSSCLLLNFLHVATWPFSVLQLSQCNNQGCSQPKKMLVHWNRT